MGSCCSQEENRNLNPQPGYIPPVINPQGGSPYGYPPMYQNQTGIIYNPSPLSPQTTPAGVRRGGNASTDMEELPYAIDDTRYKVVIAIDFGTTFSGCTLGFSGSNDLVKDIEKWPDQVGTYPKIPTALVYGPEGAVRAWGQTAENMETIGRIPPGCQYYNRFKLYLDEKLARSSDLPRLPPGKTAIDLIADFLRELHAYVLTKTTSAYVRQQMRYCLTIPASWSPDAKRSMRQAAMLAGLIENGDPNERLLLISEPEAALVSSLKIQPGVDGCNSIMICDAGGGTVDMCTFAIGAKANGDQTLREVSLGQGKSIGSVMLDVNFDKYVRNVKLGPALCSRIHQRVVPNMVRYFTQNVKTNFKPETEEYRISSPVTQDNPLAELLPRDTIIDGIDMIFTFEELRQHVFDPIIREILALIREQVNQLQGTANTGRHGPVCDKLLLVGGFGENEYLLRRIREEFMDTRIIRNVDTVVHAGLAVVRGAAQFGLRPAAVSQRVSRYSYGICVLRAFQYGVDPEIKKTRGGDGVERCDSSYFEYVKQGEAVQLSKSRQHVFKTHFKDKCPEVKIYAYDGRETPRYIDSHGVFFVGTVHIPEMPPIMRIVDSTHPLEVKINMYFGLTEITATVEIERVEYTAKFDYKNSMVFNH